jgi:hypothetical protein
MAAGTARAVVMRLRSVELPRPENDSIRRIQNPARPMVALSSTALVFIWFAPLNAKPPNATNNLLDINLADWFFGLWFLWRSAINLLPLMPTIWRCTTANISESNIEIRIFGKYLEEYIDS